MRLTALSVFLYLLFVGSLSAEVLRVGYVKGGLYETFVDQSLANPSLFEFDLELVPTQGSRDQMEKLRTGDLDLAVVQSDIAYYVHKGIRDYERYSEFATVLPLFEEYLQVIVRNDSEIYTLGRLLSGTVSVGEKGSGAFQNALDLFAQLGYRAGIDFQLVNLATADAFAALDRGDIDGFVYTGGILPRHAASTDEDYRVLDIPESVLEALSIEFPYYAKSQYFPESAANTTYINTVSVDAILVARESVETRVVAAVIESVALAGSVLHVREGTQIELHAPESSIERSALPLHDGLRQFLIQQGHVGRDYSVPVVFFVVASLIGFVVTVQLRMRRYDRMGNLTASEGTYTFVMYQLIAKSGTGLVVLFVFFLLVVGFVEAIQYFEADYARRLNVKNPFADRGFWNSLLWVITFMGAGDPGDLFPNSDGGRLLASVLPFLGIGAVLGFGYSTLERRREDKLRAREGTLVHSTKDHVLICGWNEKAPGIIYTLTSTDVPRKRHVTVVAEIDDQRPLDAYNFDLRYVSYCRGDSADYAVLERANARYADAAIVLGGLKKRSSRNIKSVLSVLALRELAARNENRKTEMLVAAELLFSENQKRFETCGASAIICSEAITDRVAAMSCVSPLMVDFTLDMLTYDDRSELYVMPMTQFFELTDQSSQSFCTVSDAAEAMLPLGVNVVAANNTMFKDKPFLDHAFSGQKYDLRLNSSNRPLTQSDELLVIADDYKALSKIKARPSAAIGASDSATPMLESPSEKHVILVGEAARCKKITDQISHMGRLSFSVIETSARVEGHSVADYADEGVWAVAGLAHADQVVVIPNVHEEALTTGGPAPTEIDADTLMIAKFCRTFLKMNTNGSAPIVVAEMLSASNQQLFLDAGVDVVIPADRLLERVISKLVYSRGAVTRFLMALLRFDDGIHLMSLKLRDPGGATNFEELMRAMPPYFQLLGVLPSDEKQRQAWLNPIGDFKYHFLTTSKQEGASDYTPKAGDDLLGIVNYEDWAGLV